MDDFLTRQAQGFGGFHTNIDGDVDIRSSTWNSYTVTLEPIVVQPPCSTVQLNLKDGDPNNAECGGLYELKLDSSLNGSPVYICQSRSRWIGWNGTEWTISSTDSMDGFLARQEKSYSGFHGSTNGDVALHASTWNSYTVSEALPAPMTLIEDASRSELFASYTNSDYAAVQRILDSGSESMDTAFPKTGLSLIRMAVRANRMGFVKLLLSRGASFADEVSEFVIL